MDFYCNNSHNQYTALPDFDVDSTITYSLFVHRNVSTTADSTVCQSELPLQWNDVTFSPESVANSSISLSATLLTTHGADSIVDMTLHVNPTYHTDEDLHICHDALPLSWHDTVITTSTPSTHYSLSTVPCSPFTAATAHSR